MKLLKQISSLLVVLAFVLTTAMLPQYTFAKSKNSGLSVSAIIELLISLEIIPEDKADIARQLAEEKEVDDDEDEMDDEDDDEMDDDEDDDDGDSKGKKYGHTNMNKYMYNNCPHGQFKKGLYLGTTGDDVTVLQKFLAGDKSIYPEGKVTGYFGPLTEKAVKRYQEKYGIEAVGVVGPKTRAKIEANCMIYKKGYEDMYDDEDEDDDDGDDDENSELTEITLEADEDNLKVTWEANGTSVDGFKVLWSLESGPEFPVRDDGDEYRYLDDPEADEAEDLEAFDGDGEYFIRVCEYIADDSECGVYSNEVTLDLEEETQS